MLNSLGFSSIVVNNRSYDDKSLSSLFSLLFKHDVSDFIFLSDFKLSADSFSLESSRISDFGIRLKDISSRGIHCKVCYNLILERGSAYNPEFKRLYAAKKFNSLFVELPLFLDTEYDELASDINYMLYRRRSNLVISNFDRVLETSSWELCKKLLSVPKLGVALDINYLFDPKNIDLVKFLLKCGSLVIPTISHDLSNYVGIMNEAEVTFGLLGKTDYYYLCNRIRKCADLFTV
jgi:hypothetical protein